jgi:hypothetical protein
VAARRSDRGIYLAKDASTVWAERYRRLAEFEIALRGAA